MYISFCCIDTSVLLTVCTKAGNDVIDILTSEDLDNTLLGVRILRVTNFPENTPFYIIKASFLLSGQSVSGADTSKK